MNCRAQFSDDPEFRKRIGEKVREARRIRHLTQAELARRVGIRAGPLNAIEHGMHVPGGRVLYRLADVLQVSIDTIMGRKAECRAEPTDRPCAPARFVAETAGANYYLTTAESGDWPRARNVVFIDEPVPSDVTRLRISQVCSAFLALEDLCGAQKCAHMPLYYPVGVMETGIEALSGQVRQFLGVGQAVVFDYLELLENAGLRIVFFPLGEGVESAAFYDPVNATAFLVVRADMNVERQLFELIKRLGSIYLHTQQSQLPRRLLSGGEMDDLHAARKFAALFLMPAAAVRASIEQLAIRPEAWTYELLLRLKHRFGVSAQSFLLRLREMELIADAAYSKIDGRIKAHYSHTNYSEPDSSRRVLSPNGRLGDLLVAAMAKPGSRREAREIERTLRRAGINWRNPGRNRAPGVREREKRP